eukprot:CAMPEP_0170494730 /NCGR_PEP_ID=MMETSP0208-20121228/14805_1 /TAXON_ID=197538 /ORGANISM="Strombidium inclinatum, Strain S3" /LENGTH=51 /DNA_ID=CAMNT_0010770823 /DNA_START=14 /DNA_END=169 /DNA_ORIENTATION=-
MASPPSDLKRLADLDSQKRRNSVDKDTELEDPAPFQGGGEWSGKYAGAKED